MTLKGLKHWGLAKVNVERQLATKLNSNLYGSTFIYWPATGCDCRPWLQEMLLYLLALNIVLEFPLIKFVDKIILKYNTNKNKKKINIFVLELAFWWHKVL